MNQDLTNELAEVWALLEAAKTRIERVEAELAKEIKPRGPWKPEEGETYWWVDSIGAIGSDTATGSLSESARRNFNNCRPTKEAAERHALRLRSMLPTCPVPEVGDEVCVATIYGHGFVPESREWDGNAYLRSLYNEGKVFAGRNRSAECQSWIAEFGDAWTTLEDEA